MGQNSSIEWTEATWNPVTGCSKVSQGCKNCYAERFMHRWEPERKFTDVKVHNDRLTIPIHWRKPRMIFVNSMSDLFHGTVSDEDLHRIFHTMKVCPQHTFQVLTKRPERAVSFLKDYELPENIWIGVSVEDQFTANERLPLLAQIKAHVRFVSAEPLLGYINLLEAVSYDLNTFLTNDRENRTYIDWVICGGESGPGARPCHPEWVRSLRDQCVDAKIPFFFKQWGEYLPYEATAQPPFWRDQRGEEWDGHGLNMLDPETSEPGKGWYQDEFYGMDEFIETGIACNFKRIGKKAAGRMLDGELWDQYPEKTSLKS